MSDTVISVENLSKSYLVGHRFAQRERYTTLRDVIGRELRNFTRKAVDLVRGTQIVQGDEVEEFWALKDVSFEVRRGEALGIIGRNGAGKSTLLKILSRITEPTQGRVTIKGRVASLLEVGTGFHPELTGRENVYLNGAILGMTRADIRRKFDDIVAFAGVDKFIDTPVKRYSSGMNVRLAFAVAAHLEPEILIIDEVLAVGDVEFQKKCIRKMQEVTSAGRTILFVSHNMAAISNLTDRSLVLEGGQVRFSENTDACIRKYLQLGELGSSMGAKYQYLQIARIYERNEKLNPIDSISMGGDIVFKVQFRTPVPTSSPRVGFVLRQQITGEPIFGVNTEMAGCGKLTELATQFEVSMIIEKLNVVHGDYVVDIYLGEQYQEDYEVAHDALRLRIVEADVFGTGRLPYKNYGPVYFVPQFTMRILNGGLDGTA